VLSAFFFSEQNSDLILEGAIAASFILGQPIDPDSFTESSMARYQECIAELTNLPIEFAREICVQVLFAVQDEIFGGDYLLCHE